MLAEVTGGHDDGEAVGKGGRQIQRGLGRTDHGNVDELSSGVQAVVEKGRAHHGVEAVVGQGHHLLGHRDFGSV